MTITSVKNVKTQGVGFAPILRHYFTQYGIERIIDENVELDPRRKVLTHGQAAVAMITGILFQVMQLYRLRKFASGKKVLTVLFSKTIFLSDNRKRLTLKGLLPKCCFDGWR